MNPNYKKLTDKIIEMLETGTVPWRCPWWKGLAPNNPFTPTVYQGSNTFFLRILMQCEKWDDPRFATFKQIEKEGGKVIKGAHGWPVVYWNFITKKDGDGEETGEVRPLLVVSHVFNIKAQTTGIILPELKPEVEHIFEPLVRAEQILSVYPGRPEVKHGGDQASYDVVFDRIQIPEPQFFQSQNGYYLTRFHEEIHSTGHSKRLNRDLFSFFESRAYAREELVAEIGAAMLCMETGIEPDYDNTVAYINNWLTALHNDHQLVVVASSRAEKAVSYILGQQPVSIESEMETLVEELSFA